MNEALIIPCDVKHQNIPSHVVASSVNHYRITPIYESVSATISVSQTHDNDQHTVKPCPFVCPTVCVGQQMFAINIHVTIGAGRRVSHSLYVSAYGLSSS